MSLISAGNLSSVLEYFWHTNKAKALEDAAA